MKTPFESYWYPLDVKKDEDGGLWFRLPQWIARGGSNFGKIEVKIRREPQCINDYRYREERARQYYKENWSKKLLRESRKRRETK